MLGKNSRKKVRKYFFIFTISLPNNRGGKNVRNNFSETQNSAIKKYWEKKSSEKSAKNAFLYSHEYSDQKMGATKRVKQFFQKHMISAIKNVGKKIVGKSAKNVFYIHTNIVTKKWGEKTRETIFPEKDE